jgi:aspartyl-tRNA(Asn)/glutamyl-tRNA(Gln) amidotransferase subunit A
VSAWGAMSFPEWQQLEPAAAARIVHERIRERLPLPQQRAAIAWLPSESELARQFEAVPGGSRGQSLGGVPYFAKDLYDAAGLPTFAGSTFLPEVRPTPARDGALVAALRAAGAVLAGKTHLHEFAYGVTGENAHYGDVEHPGFPGRTTGGSSSGSAALVAAGVAPLALGTDTGGSVRLPAAFCGLFGFRLTPHDPFIRDAFALAPTLDTAGWFTASAADMRATNAVLVPARTSGQQPRGCSLELPGLDPDVANAFRAGAERFGPPADPDFAAELQHRFSPALEIYNTLVAHEAWQVHQSWAERFRERYSPVVWQRLTRVHALATEQIQAAERGRAEIRGSWEKFFEEYDFLVLPGSPAPAFTKAECTLDNRNRILVLTAPASLGGLPVLTIPLPLPSGLTTGLQIVVKEPASPVVAWALQQDF